MNYKIKSFLRDALDLIGIITVMLAIFGTIMGGGAVGVNYIQAWQCGKFSDMSGRATEYIFWDTCYVETDTGFVRYSEYEKRAVAQNLKD